MFSNTITGEKAMVVSGIQSKNYAVTFGSQNNPVPKFRIKTAKGTLYVKEFTLKDARYDFKMYELSKFFTDNFIYNTNDPSLTKYKNPENFEQYLDMLDRTTKYYRKMFYEDDGNLTVLEARNATGDLCGAVITQTFKDECSGLSDNKTCYVDSVAVKKKYRHNHVGRILMEKAINSSKDVYTDVFLASDNLAVPFQLKNGYRVMNYKNPAEKAVIDRINKFRGDYPDYITFMDKKLNNTEEHKPWYQRIFEKIQNH